MENNIKNTKIFLRVSLIIIAVLILAIFLQYKTSWKVTSEAIENTQIQKIEVLISIEENEISNLKAIKIDSGKTAFDALLKFTEENNIIIETKEYEVGIFIESIGGVKNGQDGKYWMYYINGKLASVSADKQKISDGDKIVFKFEKSPYDNI